MTNIARIGLSATQWRFLSNHERYVEESASAERKLQLESTARQFLTARDILARLDGCCGEVQRQGVLLADDVGLGKTTVAALVAWVFASAGETRSVRILVPNDVMVRRWKEELLSHVELLQKCAPYLINVHPSRVKTDDIKRLSSKSIQVAKHSYAGKGNNLKCSLLIIDEAHRAKGEHTDFSRSLKKQKKIADRVLILTATPFSIRLEEFNRMLTLVGADHVHHGKVRAFSYALDDLYSGSTARSPELVANKLIEKARAAITSIGHHVIRHSIDDLPLEQKTLGMYEEWDIPVPKATRDDLELILRMDRILRMAKVSGGAWSGATNDPRFHVGWKHFDEAIATISTSMERLDDLERSLVGKHLKEIKKLRSKVGQHAKMVAVAVAVAKTISQGEKVVIFCHHHATAQELTECLASRLPQISNASSLDISIWKEAWLRVFEYGATPQNKHLLNTFIDWLCSDLMRTQTESWLGVLPTSAIALVNALESKRARRSSRAETIAQAAHRLFNELLESKSGKAVLRQAAHNPEYLPGSLQKNGTFNVFGVCSSEQSDRKELFIRNNQPDTIIKIFGSPFGPDVLVVTDKLSEGIDLHRYCRHLIHYELDPSPIRTVQRNGRIRRVNSWAAITGKKIRYAYPSFGGTRDEKLVNIMKKRISTFSLLLGGVQDFDIDSTCSADEDWRNEVIKLAKKQLNAEGGKLNAVA